MSQSGGSGRRTMCSACGATVPSVLNGVSDKPAAITAVNRPSKVWR